MSRFDQSHSRSAARAFHGLFALGAVMACITATVIVWLTTGAALRDFSRQTVVNEAEASAANLSLYITDRVDALRDLSAQPVFQSSALGVDGATRQANSFLKTLFSYAKKDRLTLFSLTLEPVIDFGTLTERNTGFAESNSATSAAALWRANDATIRAMADRMLENDSSTLILADHYAVEGREYIVIGVPVVMRGALEGVLIGTYRYNSVVMASAQRAGDVKIMLVGSNATAIDPHIDPEMANWSEIRTPVRGTLIEHRYFRNISALNSSMSWLLAKTAGSLALGLSISFAALWMLGKSVMLNPYRRLEASEAALAESNTALAYLADHDALTGLTNRRYLDAYLSETASQRLQSGDRLAVLHIDLDRFKEINDTLGHDAGDHVLRESARILRDEARPDDVVARIGGDEFVMIVSAGPGEECVSSRAQRVVDALRRPMRHEDRECRVGASIGVAFGERPSDDPHILLINADVALYRAKQNGRNGFVVFSEADQLALNRKKAAADEVSQAIDLGAFEPYFQPKIDAQTLDVIGFEALARWKNGAEIKGPAAFLPIADALGRTNEIDRIIMRKALAAMRRLGGDGESATAVSVNVSCRRLRDASLIEDLFHADLRPDELAFELVETVFLDDDDPARADLIQRIRGMGIGVEIDDFGTGHASMTGLLNLQPTRLKIDRSFVDPTPHSETSRRLIASIIDIGDALGVQVVAEGVESHEHIAVMRALGCDALQGYAIAKPMPESELRAWLRQWRAEQPALRATLELGGELAAVC